MEQPLGFVRQRFSPEGYLGLHLTLGLLLVILAAWGFSEIAENLAPTSSMVALDHAVSRWCDDHSQPLAVSLARIVTQGGSVLFLSIASLLGAALLAWRRAWDWLLAFTLTMLGGSLLNILLKHFFHRHRPIFENPLVTLTSYGFPSGHTMGATLFYGLLALFAIQAGRSAAKRSLIICVNLFIILAIGSTRIYLGAHYLTDVLAAMVAGSGWLAFSWTAADVYRRRRLRNLQKAVPAR
ncbi:MAG: phosphatase PAP2 family protein [Chthoniobacterales bacterium]